MRVLLAEDDPNDAFLVQRAVKEIQLAWELYTVQNGEEAIQYLASLTAAQLPCGIITDIKMPRKTGLEFLRELAASPQFASIPAAVLTSSSIDNDFHQAMEHADGYYIKPGNLQGYKQTVEKIDRLFRSFQPE